MRMKKFFFVVCVALRKMSEDLYCKIFSIIFSGHALERGARRCDGMPVGGSQGSHKLKPTMAPQAASNNENAV